MAGNKLAVVGGLASKLLKNQVRSKVIAVLISGLISLGPVAAAFAAITVVGGVAIGVSAPFQSLPTTCKPPPNIFEAWDNLEKFVTGVDCNACPVAVGGEVGETPAEKAAYIRTIIGTGNAMNVPEKGIIVALITAMTESGLKNYANDGEYNLLKNPADGTLGSSGQATGILSFAKRSMAFPHDAVGSDATSVGLFQQQAWWGTMGGSTWENDPEGTIKRLMDPTFQSQKFYSKLLSVSGWENFEYGVAAQRVQVSAFPDAYRSHVAEAQALYAQNKGSAVAVNLYDFGAPYTGGGEVPATTGSCSSSSTTTGIPLEKSGLYMVSSQFAAPRGTPHNGMDITCRQYENVYSPVSGVVTISVVGNASGFGEPAGRVHVKTDDGSVFWFWHMRNTFVKAGDQVEGGQAIGECASTGNSSGNHLHISAAVHDSNNPQIQALPEVQTDLPGRIVDPALALDILGVNICPPYVENRKTAPPGASLPPGGPNGYVVCWPQTDWK